MDVLLACRRAGGGPDCPGESIVPIPDPIEPEPVPEPEPIPEPEPLEPIDLPCGVMFTTCDRSPVNNLISIGEYFYCMKNHWKDAPEDMQELIRIAKERMYIWNPKDSNSWTFDEWYP